MKDKQKIVIGVYGLAVFLQCIFIPFNIVEYVWSENFALAVINSSSYQHFWFSYEKYNVNMRVLEKSFIDYPKFCLQLLITTILFGCVYFIFKPRGNNKKN